MSTELEASALRLAVSLAANECRAARAARLASPTRRIATRFGMGLVAALLTLNGAFGAKVSSGDNGVDAQQVRPMLVDAAPGGAVMGQPVDVTG